MFTVTASVLSLSLSVLKNANLHVNISAKCLFFPHVAKAKTRHMGAISGAQTDRMSL